MRWENISHREYINTGGGCLYYTTFYRCGRFQIEIWEPCYEIEPLEDIEPTRLNFGVLSEDTDLRDFDSYITDYQNYLLTEEYNNFDDAEERARELMIILRSTQEVTR